MSDAVVIKDQDGFVSQIAGLASQPYQPYKINDAFNRLAMDTQREKNSAQDALKRGDVLGSLYHLSYYIESIAVHHCLVHGETLGSESGLVSRFLANSRAPLLTQGDLSLSIRSLLDIYHDDHNSVAPIVDETCVGSKPSVALSWEDAKTSFRRILEYRRKIYGAGQDTMGSPLNLFRLYCLGRVAGNYNALCGANFDFHNPDLCSVSSMSYDVVQKASSELLADPVKGVRTASDIITHGVIRMLASCDWH